MCRCFVVILCQAHLFRFEYVLFLHSKQFCQTGNTVVCADLVEYMIAATPMLPKSWLFHTAVGESGPLQTKRTRIVEYFY